MALRELLLPWDAQPQGDASVNPLWVADLASLVVGGELRDLATASAWVRSGAVSGFGRDGVAVSTNGTDSLAYRNTASVSADAITLLALVEPNGTPATDRRAFSAATSANNDNYIAIGTGDSNAAKMRVLAVVNASPGSPATTSRDVFTLGTPHCVALRWVRGVGVQSFVDGALDAFSTNTQDSALPFSRTTIGALGRLAFVVHFAGRLYLGAVWKRALSDHDLQSLTANPWQLFEHRRIFVPVSAAGATTYTLSAPTYVPGSITSTGLTARVTVTAA